MEKPADQSDPVVVVDHPVDLQSPDRKPVRRRFVQKTLFPLKAHDSSNNKAENSVKKEAKKKVEVIDDDGDGEDGDDDVECCGSSQGGKRKRGRKPKANSTPKKRGGSKKGASGKDDSIIEIDDTISPNGSPQQPKEKKRVSTRNGRKGMSPAKVPSHPEATHQPSEPVDLWLEAKKTAEENSRLFAGKQLHPFFSSRKGGKRDQGTTQPDHNGCLDKRKARNVELGPIHVFENVTDDLESIDWVSWSFFDGHGTFNNITCEKEGGISSLGNSVASLNSDTINVLTSLGTSLLLKDGLGAQENASVMPSSAYPIIVDEEVTSHDLLKNIEKDFEGNELGFVTGNVGHFSSDLEQQNAILRERIMSYYLNRGTHPENSLWTNKYQPEKALEVCGNSEAVRFINEWLHQWHATDFRISKRSSAADKCLTGEDDYSSYGSDSDVDNIDEASGLKNVLLVTGPVGSGKSAAIYACAKEQGFQVIEVNASDWRNGALLKQKFGEAVGSHWLKRSQESPIGSQSKLDLKPTPTVFSNEAAALDLNLDAVEVISLSEEEDFMGGVGMHSAGNGRLPCDQGEIKTLILFEDVDATLCEDRGFISTIQQLADTGKRPMILTSNSENPMLPDSLDREEACFTMPTLKELIHHIYLVCAAEKASVQPNLIERCVQFCGGDIRKTLMHLQFWCQSQRCLGDGKLQSMCSPVMFNLDAGYCTLPKLIPWELPSPLSEFIEAEIASSLCKIKMEENHSLLEVIEEEAGNTSAHNDLDVHKHESASIEAKKEAILRGDCFVHVEDDIIATNNTFECSDLSDSPVAFARRNLRRKLSTVLSDSEDEISNNHEFPAVANGSCDDDKNRAAATVNYNFLSLRPAVANGLCDNERNRAAPAVDHNFLSLCPAADDTLNSLGDLLSTRTVGVDVVGLPSETAHCGSIDCLAVGDSYNQPSNYFVHHTVPSSTKIDQHLESVDVDHSSREVAFNSLNPSSDQLSQSEKSEIDLNMNPFHVVLHAHQSYSAIVNPRNEISDRAIHFGEAPALEIEMRNSHEEAANHCLNPPSNQLQCGIEVKTAVNRCLFPQIQADPISCTVGSMWNQSTDQPFHCGEASLTEIQHQQPETSTVNHCIRDAVDDSLNPVLDQLQYQQTGRANVSHYCSTTMCLSFNPSSEQVLRSVQEGEEIQPQYPEARNLSHISCTATGDSLNQSSGLYLEVPEQEEFQQQHPGCADVNFASFPQIDDSQKQLSDGLHFEGENERNVQYHIPENADVDAETCPTVCDSEFIANSENNQYEYSEATNINHNIYPCQSVDISCVPESTIVPETEVDEGKELPSGADLTEVISPVAADNVYSSDIRHKAAQYMQCGSDIHVNERDVEMGDSQSESEHLEATTSGCQVMDECSRMDFFKGSKSFRSCKLAAKNPVQERWDELRKADLKHYFISEHKNALEVVDVAYEMSNLISDADLLFHDCELVTDDSSFEEIGLGEDRFTFGWHDQQVQMASAIAEHGFSFYAKNVDALQSKAEVEDRAHLAWEMLASTNNSMALGKLLRLDRSRHQSLPAGINLKGPAVVDYSFKREREICLQNIVLSTVHLRSYLALRGATLHDYVASLALMSRSEASRLAEGAEKPKRRRVRVAKNYLSSGGLDLSQEDISVLTEYNSYGKVPSVST